MLGRKQEARRKLSVPGPIQWQSDCRLPRGEIPLWHQSVSDADTYYLDPCSFSATSDGIYSIFQEALDRVVGVVTRFDQSAKAQHSTTKVGKGSTRPLVLPWMARLTRLITGCLPYRRVFRNGVDGRKNRAEAQVSPGRWAAGDHTIEVSQVSLIHPSRQRTAIFQTLTSQGDSPLPVAPPCG